MSFFSKIFSTSRPDILKDIYDYFYMIPGVDLGYGYTNDDIYNMMIIELLDVYDRLKETSLKRDK